jgi:tocopherol cyclase
MVSIHYNGSFFEAVPWTGDMSWEVSPWGKWILRGRCTSGHRLFETELTAICDRSPGVVLRAPTEKDGLVYFCRDSFLADVTLSIWPLQWSEEAKDYVRGSATPIIESATSRQGGVEVGGGPWWDVWKGTSRMRQPMKALVRIPYILDQFKMKLKRKHNQ